MRVIIGSQMCAAGRLPQNVGAVLVGGQKIMLSTYQSAGQQCGVRYRLPDNDSGLRYRSSMYDLYDLLALPCQNHYLEACRCYNLKLGSGFYSVYY
jgi:hypothetical protein